MENCSYDADKTEKHGQSLVRALCQRVVCLGAMETK